MSSRFRPSALTRTPRFRGESGEAPLGDLQGLGRHARLHRSPGAPAANGPEVRAAALVGLAVNGTSLASGSVLRRIRGAHGQPVDHWMTPALQTCLTFAS